MARVSPVEIQQYLSGVDYPADKNALMQKAQEEGAPQDVLDALQGLPEKQYGSPADVSAVVSDAEGAEGD